VVKHLTTKGARWIKSEKVSTGVKSWRTTGVKMKVQCTMRITRKQRDANIAVENIKSANEIVLRLARDAWPVEL